MPLPTLFCRTEDRVYRVTGGKQARANVDMHIMPIPIIIP